MLKGTMSSLPWPQDGNARDSGRALADGGQSEPWGRTREAERKGRSRILHQNEDKASLKWNEVWKYVSLQEKQKLGRDYGQKRWMDPLRSYVKLFSTSSFPGCNQRKKLLTNSQIKILIINPYTDKQDRCQQGLWEIIPAKCLHWGKTKSSSALNQLWSNAIQDSTSALSCLSLRMFLCRCQDSNHHTDASLSTTKLAQNTPKSVWYTDDAHTYPRTDVFCRSNLFLTTRCVFVHASFCLMCLLSLP